MSAPEDRGADRGRRGFTDDQWADAVARAVVASTREQGLPTTLEDEAVLTRVAMAFGPPAGGCRGVAA